MKACFSMKWLLMVFMVTMVVGVLLPHDVWAQDNEKKSGIFSIFKRSDSGSSENRPIFLKPKTSDSAATTTPERRDVKPYDFQQNKKQAAFSPQTGEMDDWDKARQQTFFSNMDAANRNNQQQSAALMTTYDTERQQTKAPQGQAGAAAGSTNKKMIYKKQDRKPSAPIRLYGN
ncbi:MAG: hypothetical protein H6868_00220 [Rhodospirillales bacterium]|nr:hypothetical protein [Rhodospirillales bacterium]